MEEKQTYLAVVMESGDTPFPPAYTEPLIYEVKLTPLQAQEAHFVTQDIAIQRMEELGVEEIYIPEIANSLRLCFLFKPGSTYIDFRY